MHSAVNYSVVRYENITEPLVTECATLFGVFDGRHCFAVLARSETDELVGYAFVCRSMEGWLCLLDYPIGGGVSGTKARNCNKIVSNGERFERCGRGTGFFASLYDTSFGTSYAEYMSSIDHCYTRGKLGTGIGNPLCTRLSFAAR